MRIKRKKVVEYTPEQMYALVNNIRSYPEFVQWCDNAEVLAESATEVKARLHVSKGVLRKSFSTRNTLVPGRSMEMHLLEGPFKYLHGTWLFEPKDGDNCMISFDLQFEFVNPALSAMLNPIFSSMAEGLVDCFVQRAEQVYANAA